MSDSEKCDFGLLLNIECDKKDFVRVVGRKNYDDLNLEDQQILLWRSGLLDRKDNIQTICLHHEQYFGKVYERKEKKCCGVLKDHRIKAKAHTLITLNMAELLHSKNFAVVPGQKLCRQCKTKFEELSAEPTSDENMESSNESEHEKPDNILVENTDGDNSDNDYQQSPNKRLNLSLESVGVSPVNVHSVAQHSRASAAKEKLTRVLNIYTEDISNAYNVPNEDLDLKPPSKSENNKEVEQKAQELDRLHIAMKDKLAQTTSMADKIQILTLVPDSWSWSRCATFFNVSEYSIRAARELKPKEFLQNLLQRKEKHCPRKPSIL